VLLAKIFQKPVLYILIMQVKTRLFALLLIYIFQISLAPLVHYLDEIDEKSYPDLHAYAQLNSSCDNDGGPCRNPDHHHHGRHKHDHSQCLICKSFSHDIEFCTVRSVVYPDHFNIISYNNHWYLPSPLRGTLSSRAPPVTKFIT